MDRDDNPLRNAPHTAESLMVGPWTHPYSREAAACPQKSLRANQYWPPVGRADHVYGDRRLFCGCIPIQAYA